MLCENRQQPPWILRRKMSESWCTCVCTPHFFLRTLVQWFTAINYRSTEQSNQWHPNKNTTLITSVSVGYLMCENRQQPMWILGEKCAKDSVHACVLRIFFIFLCRTVQIVFEKWRADNITEKLKVPERHF